MFALDKRRAMFKKNDYSKMIGSRYNKLIVVMKDEDLSACRREEYYICQCDCGNIKSFRANDLYHNKVKSCGNHNPKCYKDITGKKFGKLTAIEYKYTLNKRSFWLCECDCGNITITCAGNLQNGHSTSCGCKRNIKNTIKLEKHFRNLLKYKILETLEHFNYMCFLTGDKENLRVHHLESFSNMYKKAIISLGFVLFDNFNEYSNLQKKEIDNKFLELHEENALVVISSEVHTKFHRIYGYKNNTKQQFDDFIDKYF
jgi:hypothetical protein